MSADDHMPGGMPERRLDERDDRTGWERENAGATWPQLCKGLFGHRCSEKARPHTGRCEGCDDAIGNMGTSGT